MTSPMETTPPGRLLGPALAAAAAALIVFALLPDWHHPFGDKTEHVVAFAVVALLVRKSRTGSRRAVGVAALVGLAASVELVQAAMLSGRTASWTDFSASCIGIAAGFAIGAATRKASLAAGVLLLLPLGLAVNWILNDALDPVRMYFGYEVHDWGAPFPPPPWLIERQRRLQSEAGG